MPKNTVKSKRLADKKVQETSPELKDYAAIFSKRLTAVVNEHGWSQEEFGRRLGTTQAMAGRYMHGKANPTFENLARIEVATQVPVSKFFENDEPVPRPTVTNLSDDVRIAVANATAENNQLLKTIMHNLEPAIAALNAGKDKLPVTAQTVSRGKLRDFVDQFTDDSMTGYIYELMNQKASSERIRIEFVRELVVNVLAEGGKTAKELRSVLLELLEKEASL